MKLICAKCGRDFDANDKYKRDNGNYCEDCMFVINEKVKYERRGGTGFRVCPKLHIPKGETLHEFILDKRFR